MGLRRVGHDWSDLEEEEEEYIYIYFFFLPEIIESIFLWFKQIQTLFRKKAHNCISAFLSGDGCSSQTYQPSSSLVMPVRGRRESFQEAGGALHNPLPPELGRSWLCLLLPGFSLYVTMLIAFVFWANSGKTEKQKSLRNTPQMTCVSLVSCFFGLKWTSASIIPCLLWFIVVADLSTVSFSPICPSLSEVNPHISDSRDASLEVIQLARGGKTPHL